MTTPRQTGATRFRPALLGLLSLFAAATAGCGGGNSAASGGASPGTSTAEVPKPHAPAPNQDPTKPKTKPRVKIAGDRQSDAPSEPIFMSKQTESSPFRFAEIAKEAGVDFVHFSGMTKAKHFPTANGSGVAVFDYDGDGKPDLYFATLTLIPVGSAKTGTNKLYKNLGGNKFRDVTAEAGVGFEGFCHGVIAGDLDNDGDQDLFLCNYGPNVLYLNNGDGTFKDISKSAGVHRPALVGVIEPVMAGAAPSDSLVTLDFVAGPAWKVGEATSTKVKFAAVKGTRFVVRQADPDAAHGLTFRRPELVQRLGEPEKPGAVVREIGGAASRLDVAAPPLAKGAGPAVIAEFEVVGELKDPVYFHCTVYDRAWSSSGACIDYDNDGDLDLYVSNYGAWESVEDDLFCGDTENKIRLYCSPRTVRTVRHFFFRNNGDHTFTEVYDKVILSIDPDTKQRKPRSDGHGFGVVTADLNGDGKPDIYVANDMNPNVLFLNNGDGTFEDATESGGAAYDEKGQAQSGMGVESEDVDGDGLPELFVTNFANEYNTLYQNLGKGIFTDSTPFFGMAADTMPFVGWGTSLADFDNDGWPDNFVTNGHVDDNLKEIGRDVEYVEIPLLFANKNGKRFRLATRDAGPYFDAKHVGRGAAVGDLDDDGDVDIVVNHKDGPAAVLRNDSVNKNHWVRLDLQGTKSNRDGLGAKVEVVAGDRTIYRQRKGGCSMESSNDPRLLIGVGAVEEITKLTVKWPSGAVTTMEHVKVDQPYKIVEPKS